MRFWKALLTLTQFETMAAGAIRAMAEDPYLREHPEIVEGIAGTLIAATYLPGTRLRRADQLRQMETELGGLRAELSRLKGSRAVRLYLRFKEVSGHGAARGNDPHGGRTRTRLEEGPAC